MELFFLLFVGVAITIAITGSVKQAQELKRSFSIAARSLELRHRAPAGPIGHHRMTGELEGFPVQVRTFRKSQGKNTKLYTRYQITMPSLGMGLVLSQEGFFTKIATALGSQDIEVGEERFDNLFQVRARDERQVVRFLHRELREYLVDAIQVMPSLRVTDSEILVEQRGAPKTGDDLQRILMKLARLARVIQAGQSVVADPVTGMATAAAAAAIPAAAAAVAPLVIPGRSDQESSSGNQQGDSRAGVLEGVTADAPAPAAPPEPAPPEPAPVADAPVEPPPLEPQLTHPDPTPVEPPTETIVESLLEPEQPSLGTDSLPMESLLSESGETEHETSEAPEAVVEPATPATPAPVPAGHVSALCQALFGESRPSYETQELFERDHQGSVIELRGKIDRVESYRTDSKLGDGPGTRVRVDLVGLDEGTYTGREVRALVGLPAEAEAEWKSRRGDEVRVVGTLHDCDAFLRTLVLKDGSLSA